MLDFDFVLTPSVVYWVELSMNFTIIIAIYTIIRHTLTEGRLFLFKVYNATYFKLRFIPISFVKFPKRLVRFKMAFSAAV